MLETADLVGQAADEYKLAIIQRRTHRETIHAYTRRDDIDYQKKENRQPERFQDLLQETPPTLFDRLGS